MIVVNKHANCIGESWTIPIEDLQQDSVAVAVEASVVRYGLIIRTFDKNT